MVEYKKENLQNAIGDVMTGILTRVREDLKTMKQEDLEQFWYFRYDSGKSKAWNLYAFQDMLRLYGGKCRQWEEMHNGHSCVVERVRDTYLMPKIKEFVKMIEVNV